MCVGQFADYCAAFRFKHKEMMTKDDEIKHERGTFYAHKRAWYYTMSKSKMKKLEKLKNPYAEKAIIGSKGE